MTKRYVVLIRLVLRGVILTAALTVPLVASAREHIDLQGVTLVLDMRRDTVMKHLEKFSLQQVGEADYWNVYSAPDSSKWIGSLLFKGGKLALVIKSWAQADDMTMNGVIKRMMVGHTSCKFTVAALPDPNSPLLKLTTLACPERQVVMQVNDNQEAGLVKCNVEVLGDPGKILSDPAFWKVCR